MILDYLTKTSNYDCSSGECSYEDAHSHNCRVSQESSQDSAVILIAWCSCGVITIVSKFGEDSNSFVSYRGREI